MSHNKAIATDQKRRSVLKLTASGLAVTVAAPLLSLGAPLKTADAAGSKVLTVCFSRTGHTQTMAQYINEAVGGDFERIRTVDAYPQEYRATTEQAKRELSTGYLPPLTTRIVGMESYSTVFVGSPCWWGTISTPVISFLSEYDFSGKTIVPFMTHQGSGLGRTMAHVATLCPKATLLQGKAVWGGSVNSSRDETADWLRGHGFTA